MLLVDTAGRLHTRRNLMNELEKFGRVTERVIGRAADEVFLILDATVGQNGLVQAEEFSRTLKVSGLILTKLDGTARGGVALAIVRALGIPIRYLGIGEGIDDLVPFSAEEFARSLLE